MRHAQIIQARYGTMLVQLNDMVVGRSLREYGEWAQTEIDFMLSFLRPAMTVVDVGANVGAHTLAFAHAVGINGTVVSIEPERTAFHTLAANIALNELQQVATFNAACGEAEGLVRVQRVDPSREGNYGMCQVNPESDAGTQLVRQISIDYLQLGSCHLIKADVEGYELAVLKGAVRTIEAYGPVLYLEANTIDKTHAVLAYVHDVLGYKAFWHVTNGFNPNNFNGNPVEIFPNADSEFALVCVPQAMPATNLIPVSGSDDDYVKLVERMTA